MTSRRSVHKAIKPTTNNSALHQARRAKNDEFYTRYEDVEAELKHYQDKFRDKTVYLNCDNPDKSAFWEYFATNFQRLGLKRLVATHYTGGVSWGEEIFRGHDEPVRFNLVGNGDFRSDECVELLKQSDVVVTNPPFSLFREYIAQLVDHGKEFLVIGNQNAITYKEVWPLIQGGKLWLGTKSNIAMQLAVPDGYWAKEGSPVDNMGRSIVTVPGVAWFTNLDHSRRHKEIPLTREYSPETYPRYDNYDAINVNKVADIPVDYDGVMGVPITFLGKWNPEQFDILGYPNGKISPGQWIPYVGGKAIYARILIKAVR